MAVVANGATRAVGGVLALLAKGVGWRRLSRIATAIMGVGLSYSGGVFLSDRGVRRAKGWTGKIKVLFATLHRRWLALHLGWKLAIVAALIASQVYLHFLLILFPIAFLVPVVRRLWVQARTCCSANGTGKPSAGPTAPPWRSCAGSPACGTSEAGCGSRAFATCAPGGCGNTTRATAAPIAASIG